MNKYIPKIYKQSILDIDYNNLKKIGIKCIMFDLDNTLLEVYKDTPKKEFCYTCGGKGYVTGSNLDGVRGRTRSRCTSCHGLGYTEEHYY